jgi:DNA-binding SARP family transcriptional activator/Tfp pilus assembly protein PilF
MELRVLGELQIRDGERVRVPSRRLARVLLGMLALRANSPLSTERITDALWSGSPPASVRSNLRSYVAELRRLVSGDGSIGPRIEAVRDGYLLRVGTAGLDLLGFESLARQGRQYLAEHAFAPAADRLSQALELWRGPVLAGLSIPDVVAAEARLLEDQRLDVVEDSFEARLALGQHAELASRLPALIAEHGLRERLWRQWMTALYRSGRQAEALWAYERLRRLLADELGVTPTPASQDLYARILRSDPGLQPRDQVAVGPSTPWQLPPAPQSFVGRRTHLAALDGLLHAAVRGPVTMGILTGTAGVGKTALALFWAHRVRERFPDGCLYADLRGYGPDQPRTTRDVLMEFLNAMGVQPPPAGLEGRYRTELAGRRMLVVLDNADSAEQVRPLLPGDSCAVLVTSRDALAGLVVRDGANRIEVDLLPEPDAIALLRTLIGHRVDAEPQTAATLANQCARLPLALRIAAELVASQLGTTLADLTEELVDERGRLDLLDVGGDAHTAVRSVLSWSNRHLNAGASRAFWLLGLHPGRHFDQYAVAALTDAPARPLIASLLSAHLIQQYSPGRYSFHDLLRSYAHELAVHAESEAQRQGALTRLFDQQAYVASVAMDEVYPYERHRRPKVAAPMAPTPAFDGPRAARDWLDAELDNLLAIVRFAADAGWAGHVGLLSATLQRHLHTRGRYLDMVAIAGLAVDAARQSTDPRAEAGAEHDHGTALLRLGRFDEALDDLERACGRYAELGDRAGESSTVHSIGMVHMHRGRLPEALDHFQRALHLHREFGDRGVEGADLGSIGLVHEWMGNFPQALDHYHRALAIHRDTGSRAAEGDTLNNIAIVHRQSGRYPQAIDHLEQALAIYRETGDRGGEGAALNNLGLARICLGEWDRAREHLMQALTLHRDINGRVEETETLNILGVLDYRTGDHRAAIERFRLTVASAIDLGVPGSQMNAHYGLGQALHQSGQPAAALVHYETAQRLARQTGARSTEADALAGAGRCLRELGHPDMAARRWRRALAIYRDLGISETGRL